MSNVQTITLDEAELSYNEADLKDPTLVLNQIFKWRVTGFEAKLSKSGNKMGVISLAPVTSQGKALTQFTQRIWVTIPTEAMNPKARKFAQDRYLNVLQSFAAPRFNAFSKVEKTETGTTYYDLDGNPVKGKEREAAKIKARSLMMAEKQAFLNGEVITKGQEAYGLLRAPKEGSEFPEFGIFTQDVSVDSKYAVAEDYKEMVS
jgi:hypothetical protein